MRFTIGSFLVAVLTLGWLGCKSDGHATETARSSVPGDLTRSFELGPLRIDRIYRSMDGPYTRMKFDFQDMDWITGFQAEVIDSHTREKLSDEFFCHSQMQFDNATRLLVTATGTPSIHFPEGFGIPLKQNIAQMPAESRGATLFGMVLNNWTPTMDREVNIRLTVTYRELPGGIPPQYKKLYKLGLPMTVHSSSSSHAEEGQHDEASCGTERKVDLVAGFRQHWLVPPGGQVTKKEFSGIVPVASTVHTALVHLHNYGVSMKLTDLTEQRMLWETKVINEPARAQIREIPTYSSPDGFVIYPDHRYEIEAVYNNTSSEPVDAMAMMYLFFHPLGNEEIAYGAE